MPGATMAQNPVVSIGDSGQETLRWQAAEGFLRQAVQALLHSPVRLPVTSWVVRNTGLPAAVFVMVLPSVSVSAV